MKIDFTKNRLNSKRNIHKDKQKNSIILYYDDKQRQFIFSKTIMYDL